MNRALAITALLLLAPPLPGAELDVEADDTGFMDEFAFLEDAGMVELAARHRQEIGMSPSAIWVITREDVEASGAMTIADLLRLVPGMEVVFSAPFFTSATARVEWTNENNMFLILIDGREANVEVMGTTYFENQPISLDDIERIEVIRGPGSSLYGANALAGVISITTRALPEETSGWAQVTAGEAGGLSLGARASTRSGDWGFSLSGGMEYSGYYTDPRSSAKKIQKLRLTADYRWSESKRLMLDAGLAQGTGDNTTSIGTLGMTLGLYTLRASFESEDIRAQLYWSMMLADGGLDFPLEYSGVRLAELVDSQAVGHTIDGEAQWTLPSFYEPLLFLVGCGGRVSYAASDEFLDAQTYSDITSPDYHQAGISHWEARAAVFLHGEYSPTDWVTVTGGLRYDYNTVTDEFLSPRLAAVFKPASGQFVRLGVARAFRKPAFLETHVHPSATFPDESPITGSGQQAFLEFMTRILGNLSLNPEELISFELGYLGQFLDDRLQISLDLYCNLYLDRVLFISDIVPDDQGLPDLQRSSFMGINDPNDLYTLGGELTARFNLSRKVALLFWWSHREVFNLKDHSSTDMSPKNLMALGGRFKTDLGLLGSLYAFSRSEFWDRWVENPAGVLEPTLVQHMDNNVLILAKLGIKIPLTKRIDIETGAKLMLPISFSSPHFRYREKGGGYTLQGKPYGGRELARVITAYLQGSF
jgi:iron complex outermembrane receptor protein